MHLGVAAWIGSPNAGDELVHAGLLRHLEALGADAEVPARGALIARAAARRMDGLVLGGGGLLQDETSGANLPYHLAPVLAARVPVAGVGLGAGPLTTRIGRSLTRRALARTVALSVRDVASADLVAGIGARRPIVAADLALNLPRPEVEVEDVLVASLRPWGGGRHRLPVALRRRSAAAVDETHAARAAAALDAAAERTGLAVRLVALEPPKDAPLLHAVAERLRSPVEVLRPAPLDVPAVVGAGRVVVAMRYHAGIAAALAGRPAVLLGYSPKVGGLGVDLDARTLPWDLADPSLLAAACVDALARPADRLASRLEALQARERGNRDVLEVLLTAAAR
jgi:polysaccharide pyruvyl transferase WcaK-like protein